MDIKKPLKYILTASSVFLLLGCQSSDDTTETELVENSELENTTHMEGDAAILAVETSKNVQVDVSDYLQIQNELIVIEAINNNLSDISAFSTWPINQLKLGFTTETDIVYQNGNYTAWDDLNTRYKLSNIKEIKFPSGNHYTLTFDGQYNTELLVEKYSTLPGILYVETGGQIGDASDICLEITDSLHYYIYDLAWEDCPSGCAKHIYSGFSVDAAFNVTILGTYINEELEPMPEWFRQRSECRKWL